MAIRAQLEKLSAIGINVFWLAPRRFEEIAQAVEQLALLTGQPEVGRQRAANFREGLSELQTEYAAAPQSGVLPDLGSAANDCEP